MADTKPDAKPDTVAADEAADTDADANPDAGQDEGPETAYGCPVTWSRGQRVLHVERDRWRELAAELLADGWNVCIDVTSVDYLTYRGDRTLPAGLAPERFEVVATFLSHRRGEHVRVRAQVPADDARIQSLYDLYPGADFLEREVYDLMGISFDDHPDLSRILMPENWEGHPLRKDYAVNAIPVQFKAHDAEGVS